MVSDLRPHDPLCGLAGFDCDCPPGDPLCWLNDKQACDCDLIARVRAEYEDAPIDQGPALAQILWMQEAEAVAAKLVEVICEQERRPDWLELTLALDEAKAERDAARAEVAAHGLEVAQAHADAHREVLADLRAKVEGLPQHEVLIGSPLANGGWARYTAAAVRRSDVLALIEEVGR